MANGPTHDPNDDLTPPSAPVGVDIANEGAPPELFICRITFSSSVRLDPDDAMCRRSPGRLVVFVPAVEATQRKILHV